MGGVYYHFYRWNLKGSVKGDLSEESLDHLNCRLDKEVCQITSEDFSKKKKHCMRNLMDMESYGRLFFGMDWLSIKEGFVNEIILMTKLNYVWL